MLLTRALSDFVAHLTSVERLAPLTRHGYERDLQTLIGLAVAQNGGRSVQVTAFTPEIAKRVVAEMTDRGLSASSVRRTISAMRKFASWGVGERLWAVNPTLQLKRPRVPRRLPKPFRAHEIAKLMALELSQQERAIRGLLFYTGMRAAPLCALAPAEIDLTPCEFTLSDGRVVPMAGRIRTIGKGDVEVVHYVQPELKNDIAEQWRAATDQQRPTLLWRTSGKPFSIQSLWDVTHRWGVLAEVERCHPHRARHTFASELRRRGYRLEDIQQLLGHASIATTQMYAEVDDARLAEAASSFSAASWQPSAPAPASSEARIAALEAELANLRRIAALEAEISALRGTPSPP